MFTALLQEDLQARRERLHWRSFRQIQGTQGTYIQVDGKRCLNFSSNDYLGLAADPRLCAAYTAGIKRYGVGAASSHYICGHFDIHEQLCEALARFCQRERVMLFSSGYMANLGIVSTLLGRNDVFYQDRLNHASLLDAGILSKATVRRFKHCNTTHLKALLERDTQFKRRLIAVEGVFSMDGDIAPLQECAYWAHKYDACLLVDDAHGFGVLGARGGGVLEHLSLNSQQVPLLMGTFGKALGVCGAFVAGDAVWIDSLEQFARTAIYTTAMSPAQAYATLAALELSEQATKQRKHLRSLIKMFREESTQYGLQLMDSQTPIQPLIVGEAKTALAIAEQLWEQGIWVPAIRPPTVPAGTSRLRISLSAGHTESDVSQLLDALKASTKHII